METKEHYLSGKTNGEDYFCYHATNEIDFLEILKVLRDERLGCIFKKVIPEQFSDIVYNNAFGNKELIKQKMEQARTDEAPPLFVGTQHYKKYLDYYLNESERVLPELLRLFNGIELKDNFFYNFIIGFTEFLRPYHIEFRLAEHGGRKASPFWIRAFDAAEEFLISPHDDVPQLACEKQAGFEIQNVHTIIAVNAVLENENGGMLLHYNLEPDHSMRKAYGIEYTGYPYPLDILENVPKIELETQKGDFYFLNANNIHAVRVNEKSKKLRTTFSWFMGFKDSSTILYWI